MKKLIKTIIVLSILALATGCRATASVAEPTVATEEPTATIKESEYKTEADWALYEQNYMFAVEVPTYAGDIFEAGKYVFEVVAAQEGREGMYDIYIESKEYNSLSELSDADYTVGGIGGAPVTLNLKAGQYVYIVPYKKLVYKPTGYLSIEKQ